jgi:hypothetical protein
MRVVLLSLALLVSARPLLAQTVTADPVREGVRFLTHYAFHLNAEHLSSDDRRFTWDTNFGGELDFVDYGHGRGVFYANYQAVLGEEFRPFDPSQGNYVLGGLATGRAGALEVTGQFHHESRHLSDRFKRLAVDWNMIGGGVRHSWSRQRLTLDSRADIRGVVFKSYVDYNWELDSDARLRYGLTPAVAVIAGSGFRLVGTDGSRARGTQVGVRGEGGLRVTGDGAALELFLAVERRVDPYPLEFGTATWFTAGFRLLSR